MYILYSIHMIQLGLDKQLRYLFHSQCNAYNDAGVNFEAE